MSGFFAENSGTIIISLALIGVVAAIIAKMVRDKKEGKCTGCGGGCGGGCGSCPEGHKASAGGGK